jgi:hypothetical protein
MDAETDDDTCDDHVSPVTPPTPEAGPSTAARVGRSVVPPVLAAFSV